VAILVSVIIAGSVFRNQGTNLSWKI